MPAGGAAPCRADSERAQRQVRELQGRVRSTEARLAPLQSKIRELEAAGGSAAAELASARDQADRWQKRAQQLMQKYESVDQQEHQRVLAELREAQDKARAAEAAAAAAAAEAGALQQVVAGEREALAGVRRRLEEAEKENAAAAGRAEELSKAKVGGAWFGCTCVRAPTWTGAAPCTAGRQHSQTGWAMPSPPSRPPA